MKQLTEIGILYNTVLRSMPAGVGDEPHKWATTGPEVEIEKFKEYFSKHKQPLLARGLHDGYVAWVFFAMQAETKAKPKRKAK